jgi:prepilin-type N-terminal cleavage/methylation domain-containing protein
LRVHRGKRPGYTLLEMMVVLSIAAVALTAGTIVMQRSRINRQLDAAGHDMHSALQYARQIAFTNNGTIFAIGTETTGKNFYTVTTVAGNVIVDKTYIPDGITLAIGSAMNPLNFAINGAASNGGTYTLTASTGRVATITVQQQLGTSTLSIH